MATVSGLFSGCFDREDGSLPDTLCHFQEKDLHTDVRFQVACGESFLTFSGHRLVLALQSPVFARMFFGPDADHDREVDISDVLPSAFDTLLKFCYGLSTELRRNRHDIKFLLKVYRAATKYEVEALKQLCCQMLCSSTPTKDNIFDLLDASRLAGLESLKLRCYKVLQSQTRKILSSQDIDCVSGSVVDTVLDFPTLSLDSEFELLSWLLDWGSCQSTRLGQSLKEIMSPYASRMYFTSLTAKEFELLVRKHEEFVGRNGIFDASEGFTILRNIIHKGSCPLPIWMENNQMSRIYVPE